MANGAVLASRKLDIVVCTDKVVFFDTIFERVGPIASITTRAELIWDSTNKHRRDVLSGIKHLHPIDWLSCLAWTDFIIDTSGISPCEHYTTYQMRSTTSVVR